MAAKYCKVFIIFFFNLLSLFDIWGRLSHFYVLLYFLGKFNVYGVFLSFVSLCLFLCCSRVCINIQEDGTIKFLFGNQEIGDLYEHDQNIEKSTPYFERAAELFEIGGGGTSANQCKLKVAQFAAQNAQ